MNRFPRIFALMCLVTLGMLVMAGAPLTQPGMQDLMTIRERIVDSIKRPVNPGQAAKLLASVRPDGTFPDVPYDDRGPGDWKAASHLSHVLTLARWYQVMNRGEPEKDRMRDTLFRSIDFWLEKDYQNSNWWWNVIGVPGTLSQIYMLLDDELEGRRREKGIEIIARGKLGMTGGNLADVVNISIRRGILERNLDLVSQAVEMMTKEIAVTLGEGIQPDFSFYQHGTLLYNHGYGAVFLSNCSELANVVVGTAFTFPGDKIELISRLILDGNQWMIRYGTKDYGATGRGISRISGNTPSAWYLRPIVRNMLSLGTLHDPEFRNLLSRLEGDPSAPLIGNRHYWRSDYMAHHRSGYFASARMFSNRLFNTDGPSNEEGLKSHHLSDGCTYIMRTGREYHDIFPVWDWQKIPGTTVQVAPGLEGKVNIRGTRPFAGGVSDGRYGCAAFDFERTGLFARKAWFFFDDEFVCLGAGISCDTKNPVITTMNQCFLKGDVTVSRKGSPQLLSRGSRLLDTVEWVYHDSTAYLFPGRERVHLSNDTQSGSWWEINHILSKDTVAHDVFTLWIDHGASPKNSRYSYIVAPNLKLPEIEAYSADPPVEVLSNEPGIQAVRQRKTGITGIAFYEQGRLHIGKDLAVEVDHPCLLLVRETGGGLEVSASNPENKGLRLTVKVWGSAASKDSNIPETVIFDLPDGFYAGMSLTRFTGR